MANGGVVRVRFCCGYLQVQVSFVGTYFNQWDASSFDNALDHLHIRYNNTALTLNFRMRGCKSLVINGSCNTALIRIAFHVPLVAARVRREKTLGMSCKENIF